MRRILPVILFCAGILTGGHALASNSCLTQAGDPTLTFPGTGLPYVYGVKDDPTYGYLLSLCSPTTLDLSTLSSYGFADFNHDGWEDLMFGISSSHHGGEVQVFLNDKKGSGTVVLSTTLATGAAAAPSAVNALDLNGDGWDDIVSANASDGTFSVMLNNGSGAFPAVQQYAMGSDVALLATVDVNGDGDADMITLSVTDQTVSVSLNNGDGTFAAPAIYPLGGAVTSLVVADIDNDGHPDIYVTSLSALLGNIFAPPSTPSTATGGSQQLMNNGDGTFTARAWHPYVYGSSSGSVSIAGGVDMTVSVSAISQLFNATGSTSPVAATSGTGVITLPKGVTQASATPTGGTSAPSGNKGSTSDTGGGGALEWMSLAFLGLAAFLRRKIA